MPGEGVKTESGGTDNRSDTQLRTGYERKRRSQKGFQ